MRIISGDHQAARTLAALDYAMENDCILVVPTIKEAFRLFNMSCQKGKETMVISYSAFRKIIYRTGMRGNRYVIDNLDAFFNCLCVPDTIEAVTIMDESGPMKSSGLFTNIMKFFKKQGE